MEETRKQKLRLNNLEIILGTKCNLKCKHCMGGDPPSEVTISEEVIDCLLDDIQSICDLGFVGYEPTFYKPQIRIILEKIEKRRIQVNYTTFLTNGVSFDPEYLQIYNDFNQRYCINPEESHFLLSSDDFHLQGGFTKEKLETHIAKYKKQIKYGNVLISDLPFGISIIGRSKNLTLRELELYDIVRINKTSRLDPLEFREVCRGGKVCKGGKNCVVSSVCITPHGYIYNGDTMAFHDTGENNFIHSYGNIKTTSLSEIIYPNIGTQKELDFVFFRNKGVLYWEAIKITYEYITIREKMINAIKLNNKQLFDRASYDFRSFYYQKIRTSIQEHVNAYSVYIQMTVDDYAPLYRYGVSFFRNNQSANINAKKFEELCCSSRFAPDNLKDNLGYDYSTLMDYRDSYYNLDYSKFIRCSELLSQQLDDTIAKNKK